MSDAVGIVETCFLAAGVGIVVRLVAEWVVDLCRWAFRRRA